MAVWVGWQAQLLNAANLPTDEAVQEFLFDWSQHAASSCRNNPIDVSHAASGAGNCHKLTSTRTAKNYSSHAQAATAFAREIGSGSFPALAKQLKAAAPYEAPSVSAVVADLVKWGSPGFAAYYSAHAHGGSGTGSGPSGAPKGHAGYRDLQKALATSLPTNLRRSSIIRRRVLHKLGAPRRVGG